MSSLCSLSERQRGARDVAGSAAADDAGDHEQDEHELQAAPARRSTRVCDAVALESCGEQLEHVERQRRLPVVERVGVDPRRTRTP